MPRKLGPCEHGIEGWTYKCPPCKREYHRAYFKVNGYKYKGRYDRVMGPEAVALRRVLRRLTRDAQWINHFNSGLASDARPDFLEK